MSITPIDDEPWKPFPLPPPNAIVTDWMSAVSVAMIVTAPAVAWTDAALTLAVTELAM